MEVKSYPTSGAREESAPPFQSGAHCGAPLQDKTSSGSPIWSMQQRSCSLGVNHAPPGHLKTMKISQVLIRQQLTNLFS